MARKWNIPLTYKPKIAGVMDGETLEAQISRWDYLSCLGDIMGGEATDD